MHVDLFFQRLQRRGQKFAANHFSSIQIIVFYYILMTVLSLVLFYLPIFREPDSHVSFVDMLFMAISTVSVTGLSTFDINSVFNDNGHYTAGNIISSWWFGDHDDFYCFCHFF